MTLKRLWATATFIGLLGCAVAPNTRSLDPFPKNQLTQLLPADAILLGEQHDAPDHQRIHLLTVEALAAQQILAALVLEMASAGQSTKKLDQQAGEDQVRAALQWDNGVWPWATYGPVVMAAVRAGVPVIGANLPTTRLREVMADTELDKLLSGPALKAQQQNIRRGHCEMLPENQISPMTRIQIARDVSMAQAMIGAALPGKTVLLLAGSGHVNRSLGIPQHLPPDFKAKAVLLQAEPASPTTETKATFDQVWVAQPAPAVDYCANFIMERSPPSNLSTPGKTP